MHIPTLSLNKATAFTVAFGLLLVNPPALQARDAGADGYRLNLELGLQRSDNPLGNSPRGPADTFLVPRADFEVHRLGSRWQARGSGDLEYRVALEDVVEDEFRANLVAAVDWTLLPGSLDWTFQNVASVEPIDFRATDSSDNLQQTNVFMTGPSWQIRPRAMWGGTIDARYTHGYAEDTDAFNSDRLGFRGALLHRFDASRQMSIGAEVTEVSYRDIDTPDADHRRLDLLARYSTRAAHTELELDAGHTRISPDQAENISAPMARVQLVWSRDGVHSLRLLALHELSDSTRQLTGEMDQIGRLFVGDSRLPIGADIFRLTSIETSWRYRYSRGELRVQPFYRDYDFETGPEVGFDEFGLSLRGSFRVRPLTTLLGSMGVDRRRFELDQRRDTDWLATLFLEHRFAPRWSGRAGAIRFQRNSSIQAADNREMIVAAFLTFHAGR